MFDTRLIACAAATVVALVAGACSNAAEPGAQPEPAVPAAPVEPMPEVPVDPPHEPDQHGPEIEAFPTFGFVHEVDASSFPATVTFDDAQMFSGEAAEAAYIEDHGELAEEGLPNDYYIQNTTRGLSTYPMVGNVVIIVSTPDGTETVLDVHEWQERIEAQAQGEAPYYEPYHVVFDGTEIVEVRMQYLP